MKICQRQFRNISILHCKCICNSKYIALSILDLDNGDGIAAFYGCFMFCINQQKVKLVWSAHTIQLEKDFTLVVEAKPK